MFYYVAIYHINGWQTVDYYHKLFVTDRQQRSSRSRFSDPDRPHVTLHVGLPYKNLSLRNWCTVWHHFWSYWDQVYKNKVYRYQEGYEEVIIHPGYLHREKNWNFSKNKWYITYDRSIFSITCTVSYFIGQMTCHWRQSLQLADFLININTDDKDVIIQGYENDA